jgi:hypothetical protein
MYRYQQSPELQIAGQKNASAMPNTSARYRYTPSTSLFLPSNQQASVDRSQSPTSRLNLKVQPNTHSRQLNIQIPQNTRHSNLRNILATSPFLARLVLPAVVLRLLALDLVTAASATHAESVVRSATAGLADGGLCGEERAAALADPGFGVIGAVEQTILQQESGSVSKQSVALHLSDTDTSTLGTTFDGLAGERRDGTGGTDLELVVDHVTETLVVDDSDVYVGAEFLAGDAGVHGLVAVVVVAGALELVAEVLRGCLAFLVLELEGRGVLRQTVESTGLAGERLDEHTDGHTGGESVRVDDDIGLHAGLGERHVGRRPLL